MHIFVYGSLFGAMLLGIQEPLLHIVLQEFVAAAFTEGDLAYIGAAYESGNVLLAAAATFANNYLLQTIALTLLASFGVPMFGLFKTAASVVLVGLAMPPLWTGMAGGFTFHSVTMVLEFEAYIFACIAVWLYWAPAVRAVYKRGPLWILSFLSAAAFSLALLGIVVGSAGILGGSVTWIALALVWSVAEWQALPEIGGPLRKERLQVLGSTAILAGIMLAIAGLYEAATLILLR